MLTLPAITISNMCLPIWSTEKNSASCCIFTAKCAKPESVCVITPDKLKLRDILQSNCLSLLKNISHEIQRWIWEQLQQIKQTIKHVIRISDDIGIAFAGALILILHFEKCSVVNSDNLCFFKRICTDLFGINWRQVCNSILKAQRTNKKKEWGREREGGNVKCKHLKGFRWKNFTKFVLFLWFLCNLKLYQEIKSKTFRFGGNYESGFILLLIPLLLVFWVRSISKAILLITYIHSDSS